MTDIPTATVAELDDAYIAKMEDVAVGMPVARHPPHRSPRAALPHEALISDEWRRSDLGDRDGEHAASESSDQQDFATSPMSDDLLAPMDNSSART